MSTIGELTRYQSETLGPLLCDLCDAEPVTIDREWLGPGSWLHTDRCPECGRQSTIKMGTMVSLGPNAHESRLRQIKQAYTDSEMSVASLERSLDRLFGLTGQENETNE